MTILNTEEYSKKRGVSKVAVTRAMKKGKKLINISSYKKQGRDWMLIQCNSVAKIKKGVCVVIQK